MSKILKNIYLKNHRKMALAISARHKSLFSSLLLLSLLSELLRKSKLIKKKKKPTCRQAKLSQRKSMRLQPYTKSYRLLRKDK